jgi:hypothetical protein
MKKCVVCGSDLPPRKSKYCCKACHNKAKADYAITQRIKAGDPTVGLGKGGSNKKGSENKQFKTGMGNFYDLRKHLRATVTRCQRCSKDLSQATRYEWCVHHKDHNRANNVIDNLEMLCKRCHQLEHECWKAFD